MKYSILPLIALLSASGIQAAVLDVSGTIVSTNPTGVPHEGTIVGTFDNVSKELGITVSFQLMTTLNGTDPTVPTTLPGGVALTIGDPSVGGSVELTAFSFSFVSKASNAPVGSFSTSSPFSGTDHIVDGTFTLNPTEEAALLAGNIYTRIAGDDALGFGALSAAAIPEPSAALLSFAGLALLARRRRA